MRWLSSAVKFETLISYFTSLYRHAIPDFLSPRRDNKPRSARCRAGDPIFFSRLIPHDCESAAGLLFLEPIAQKQGHNSAL